MRAPSKCARSSPRPGACSCPRAIPSQPDLRPAAWSPFRLFRLSPGLARARRSAWLHFRPRVPLMPSVHRHLEHQLGPPAHRSGRRVPRRASSPTSSACRRPSARTTTSRCEAFAELRLSRIAASTARRAITASPSLSRLPFDRMRAGAASAARTTARHVAVTLGRRRRRRSTLHNFYVPAGGDEPDPDVNEKFAHKLAFLDEMRGWLAGAETAPARPILVGDLNIAPLENDVWSHKQLLERRQPHAGRDRRARARCAGGRRLGRRRCATSCRRSRSSTRGGATAPPTGRRPTAAAGSTMSGCAAAGAAARSRCRCSARRAAGPRPSDHVPVLATFDL